MNAELDPTRGPTLYDFAGVSVHATDPELFEALAQLSSHRPGAARIRASLSLEALLDADYREIYDDHLRKGTPWREENQLPLLPQMPPADWGTPEMGEWVRQTGEILTPRRPAPTGLARLGRAGRDLVRFRPPRFLFAVLVLIGAAPFLMSESLPLYRMLDNRVDGNSVALALTTAVAFLVGAFFSAPFEASKSWIVRGSLLFGAPLAAMVSVWPATAVAVGAMICVGSLVGLRAEKAYQDWAAAEIRPPAARSPWEPVDGRSSTRLGASTVDPVQAASVLRAWATRLGHPVAAASPQDLVAATVAADCWAFALGADSLTQAASFGPASLGAISAAVARAAGFAEPSMPILPGPDATERRMAGLSSALLDWKSWAELQLGRRDAATAVAAAAGDLVWGGGNEDRLSRLARTLLQ
jgi:hypothetical protein